MMKPNVLVSLSKRNTRKKGDDKRPKVSDEHTKED
jgi:hypothetical protein